MKKCLFLFVVFILTIGACTRDVALSKYIDSIIITNKINDVIIGEEYEFKAAYYPLDAEGFEMFTWQSSNNAIAIIDQTGLLKAVDEGEVTIKLSAEVTSKKGKIELTDEVTIHVAPIDIEGIRLNRDSVEILNRSTAILTVSFVPENAKPKEIEWMSSNETVASVVDGVVTAKSVGHTIITAQIKGVDIKAICNVKVNPIVVTGMHFEIDTVKLEIEGEAIETKLIIVPDSADNKIVQYTSSNPSIASVNSNGVITGLSNGTVNNTGTGPGKAIITATSMVSGVKAVCNVEVYSVPDLVTMSVEKEAMAPTALGLSGYIKPTLHNNSSKPINIVRFRILDRYDAYDVSIPIGIILDAHSSHPIEGWIQFKETNTPRAVFTFEYEGREYRCADLITP